MRTQASGSADGRSRVRLVRADGGGDCGCGGEVEEIW